MKLTKKIFYLLLALCLIAGLAACGAKENEIDEPANDTDSAEDTTAAEDAAAVDETPAEKKPVILAVSFGSSYNETREATIDAIEAALQTAYPEYEVRRAFTAQTIIDILKDREKMEIDNVEEAMERLVADGIKEVVIQPTHVIPGFEYDDVVEEVSKFAGVFDSMKVGVPLLSSDKDFDTLVGILKEETADYNAEGTAVVFMGHGTHHEANACYTKFEEHLHAADLTNYFVGTVEGSPLVEEVLEKVDAGDYKKVVLLPLMIVAGDHATNDMASDEEDSWKTVFSDAGYEVECVLKGMGEYIGVQEMIVAHAAEAIASAGPIAADQIKAGTYEINVESSSSMFKIVKCALTVKDGSMSAVITMSGDGYDQLFLGTGEEAEAASEKDYIKAVLDSEGAVTFTLPLEELNVETDCAAWSIKKEKWYDRTLVFRSDAIPADALITE